jgi:hypothetical protein
MEVWMQSNAPFFTCAGYGFLNNGKATSCIEELAMQKTTYITKTNNTDGLFHNAKATLCIAELAKHTFSYTT